MEEPAPGGGARPRWRSPPPVPEPRPATASGGGRIEGGEVSGACHARGWRRALAAHARRRPGGHTSHARRLPGPPVGRQPPARRRPGHGNPLAPESGRHHLCRTALLRWARPDAAGRPRGRAAGSDPGPRTALVCTPDPGADRAGGARPPRRYWKPGWSSAPLAAISTRSDRASWPWRRPGGRSQRWPTGCASAPANCTDDACQRLAMGRSTWLECCVSGRRSKRSAAVSPWPRWRPPVGTPTSPTSTGRYAPWPAQPPRACLASPTRTAAERTGRPVDRRDRGRRRSAYPKTHPTARGGPRTRQR